MSWPAPSLWPCFRRRKTKKQSATAREAQELHGHDGRQPSGAACAHVLRDSPTANSDSSPFRNSLTKSDSPSGSERGTGWPGTTRRGLDIHPTVGPRVFPMKASIASTMPGTSV